MTEGAREQSRGTGRISHRAAAWLAWSVAAVCVVVMMLTLLFDVLNPSGLQGGTRSPFMRSSRFSRCCSRRSVPWSSLDIPVTR